MPPTIITADFTGSTLTFPAFASGRFSAFNATFADPYFSSFQLLSNSLVSTGLAAPLTFSFSGDTLDIAYAGSSSPAVATANFTYNQPATTTATPEPSTLALLGTGLFGIFGVARRQLLGS